MKKTVFNYDYLLEFRGKAIWVHIICNRSLTFSIILLPKSPNLSFVAINMLVSVAEKRYQKISSKRESKATKNVSVAQTLASKCASLWKGKLPFLIKTLCCKMAANVIGFTYANLIKNTKIIYCFLSLEANLEAIILLLFLPMKLIFCMITF